MIYEALKNLFTYSQMICEPDEFVLRQRKLLHGIAQYLLERDMPAKQEDSESVKTLERYLNDIQHVPGGRGLPERSGEKANGALAAPPDPSSESGKRGSSKK